MSAQRAVAWVAVLALLLASTPALAGTIPVQRVSRPDEQAMQAQNPTWGVPTAPDPMLTFEVNDRSRRIYLRVASRTGDEWTVTDVPLVAAGAPGSFLLSDEWADRAVAWADARGFFFTRTLDSQPQLYYFDVAPHRVPWEIGAVEDPAVSPDGQTIVVSATDGAGTDLHVAPTGRWNDASALTTSPAVVEHGPAWFPAGNRLAWAATDRDRTQLWVSGVDGGRAADARVLYSTTEEILVTAPCPFPALPYVASTVRTAEGRHDLIVINAAGQLHRRVVGVYVEPGRPGRPAWTPDGLGLVYVADDAAAGNPVRILNVTSGHSRDIPLELSGALEVAVGAWRSGAGPHTLLAVVAVGDDDDVRNHVYVADITDFLEGN